MLRSRPSRMASYGTIPTQRGAAACPAHPGSEVRESEGTRSSEVSTGSHVTKLNRASDARSADSGELASTARPSCPSSARAIASGSGGRRTRRITRRDVARRSLCYTRAVPRLLRFAVLGPVFAAMACGSESATISVTTGGESDALTRDPAVTSFVIDAVDRSGGVTQLVQSPYPTTSAIDLGNPSQSAVVSLQLTGKDATNDAVVWGAVPYAELGAFNGATVP